MDESYDAEISSGLMEPPSSRQSRKGPRIPRKPGRVDRSSDLDVVEKAVHHIGVNVSKLLMTESLGKRPDDGESDLLPQGDGRVVRADYEVVLHRQEAGPAGFAGTVQPHGLSHPSSSMSRIDHERRVRHVRAQIPLVRNDLVHTDDPPLILRHIGGDSRTEPVHKGVLATRLGSEDVGISGRDHGAEMSQMASKSSSAARRMVIEA